MPETDLESHISRVISENPSLWNADKAIELKQLSVDLYTFNDLTSTETYESRKMDVTKASNTYADAKEQTEKGLRDLYQSIRKAEDSYEGIQESLTVAEEALQATKVQFDVGMATRADLSERELTIAQLKEKLATLTISHDNAVQAFFKPWAAGSSAQ
jgi:outer membrane protein TolC